MAFKLPAASEFGGAVEDGVYAAKFVKYFGPKEGKWGQYVDFVFQIVNNEDYEGQELTLNYCGITSKKFKSTCAALNGGEYDEDADLDDYLNKPVKIMVEQVEKGENIYSNITNVKPGKSLAARKPKPAPKPVDDFDVEDEEWGDDE